MGASRHVSRRKLAGYVAEQLMSGHGDSAVRQAAAYMIETKQTHAVDLLVRDIEEILAAHGTVVADITSARKLGDPEKNTIAKLLGAKHLEVRETIDPSVLGGVRVAAAGKRLDATVQAKIDALKEIDSRKGTA